MIVAMHTIAQRLLIACLLVFAATAAPSASAADCRLVVREGWVRLPPPKTPMMAGYARLVNPCPVPVTVVGASSPSFASVGIHETRMVEGVSRMRPVPQLRLPPDGSALFKPGGMHLMLMQPGAPLKPGSRIVIQFDLAGGGKALGEFEVRKPEL